MFVLFLLLPRLKYHRTKLHTGLALQDPGKKTQNKTDLNKPGLIPLPYSIKVGENGLAYSLVLGQTSHTTMVSPLPLVGGVLGQSHVNLGLELISKVTVL